VVVGCPEWCGHLDACRLRSATLRLRALEFRDTAKRAQTEGIRHDLEALAMQYEELADYVEASARVER
jgi:hypothetical protein